MKLKTFDIDDVLYKSKTYKSKTMLTDLKQKLSPYVLGYAINDKDDNIGICLVNQKKNIINVLKAYGEVNTAGNFINTDTFFCMGDYGWDNIILGNYELDADEVWIEFGKLLKNNEQNLLDAGDNFKDEWCELQKLAIRNIWDNMVKDIKKEIEYTEKDLNERIGMYK